MIRQVTFLPESEKGYAYILELLKELPDPLKFPPAITVLFGPNGCGKSTLLRMIGRETYCFDGFGYMRREGWCRMPQKEEEQYTEGRLAVEWDGGLTYFRDYTNYGSESYTNTKRPQALQQQAKAGQFIGERRLSDSRGESTMGHLQSLEGMLKIRPTIDDLNPPEESDFGVHGSRQQEFTRWKKEALLSRGPAQGYTLLLDEPDAHLSLPEQVRLWQKLPKLSEKYDAQIIVTSHSPLVLFNPELHLVEFSTGYVKKCKNLIKKIVDG